MNRIKTLVIGGNGFIGAKTIPLLIENGRSVTVIGRRETCDLSDDMQFTYLSGDFGDLNFITDLLDDHDEVIHFAYASVPNTSFENPLADLLENLTPTVQLFVEAAKRSKKVLLVSSGGTVYGNVKSLPIVESHPTNPISPYGVTKLTLERYAYLYGVTHGLDYIVVRPANAYGVGQRPFAGQGLISTAIACAKQKKKIQIYGGADTIRDYIEVNDLAAGIVAALVHGKSQTFYNIGSGIGVSNLDVINKLNDALIPYSASILMEQVPKRVFDVDASVLDSSKLKEHSGWHPKADFEETVAKTVKWIFEEFE